MTAPLSDVLRRLVGRDDGVVFDVGANRGQTTELYRVLFADSTIHAFEPQRDLFEDMQRRLGGLERIVLNRVALADRIGTATLHKTNKAETSSLLPLNADSAWARALDMHAQGHEEVATETLDHYCAAHGVDAIDLLKLDVQGYEPECLRGAAGLLAARRIRVLQVELTYHEIYARASSFSDVETMLTPHGYRLFSLQNILVEPRTGELLSLDAIYRLA
jgi:FkbM family methyltransferase